MITRFNFKEIEDHVNKKEFTILIGARQIGNYAIETTARNITKAKQVGSFY